MGGNRVPSSLEEILKALEPGKIYLLRLPVSEHFPDNFIIGKKEELLFCSILRGFKRENVEALTKIAGVDEELVYRDIPPYCIIGCRKESPNCSRRDCDAKRKERQDANG